MASRNQINNAITKTLCYAQIFSYPLTETELWQYLLHNKKISKKTFTKYLYQNLHVFEQIQEYIVLRHDSNFIGIRIKRYGFSVKKLRKATIVSRILFCIPTVKLIGVSGSVSMYNAKKEDDIDLFFITSKNFLWTTRFMVNLVLCMLGQKRMRGKKYAQDKICPNMFMSEESLRIKKTDQNVYTAHEVAQMKVLFAKQDIYLKFLSQNAWVLRYMPNAFTIPRNMKKKKKNSLDILLVLLSPLEKFLYGVQYFYMKKKITSEKVSKTTVSFYPSYHKKAILEIYGLKTLYQIGSGTGVKKQNLASNYKQVN